MSYPTDEEKQLITKFRSRVFDILKPGEDRSDQFLVKWIRAQDHNLEKAELMIRKSFDWRRDYNVDDILSQPPDPFFAENFPFRIHGTDTLGHPVAEIQVGRWDVSRVVAEGREGDFLLYTIYMYETMMQRVREANTCGRKPWEYGNTQLTAVVDWTGYTVQQLVNFRGVQLFLKFASFFDAHYPETLYKAFYVNCPTIFPKLWTMLKPVLRDKTVSKIKVYGTNRAEWEPKLKRLIHENQLSPEYGGTAGSSSGSGSGSGSSS